MPRDSDSDHDDDVPLSQRVVEREAEEEDPDAESQDLDDENWSGPGHEAWVQAHPSLFVNADQMLRDRRERQAAEARGVEPEQEPVTEEAWNARLRAQQVELDRVRDGIHELQERQWARERRAPPGPPEAPAQAAPVQEAARVANPRLQRMHVPRCAGVPTLEWLSFVKYVIEEGFGFVEHDMHGAVYERVRPE